MSNNNLTNERLSALIRVARDSLELYEMELPVIDDVMLALAELQQRRAAMLQGAGPVSQHPELTVWYGSMPESNGKTNWTAILHRKGEGIQDGMTIDRSEYPDRVLYAADRVRYLIGEKADRPCILDYDADAHSGYVKPGNSPATPDGWVACSERMPEQFVEVLVCTEDGSRYVAALNHSMNWDDGDFFDDIQYVTHWMPLPAAPQQEVK